MGLTASYGALGNEENSDPELAWRIRHGLEKPAKRNDVTMKLCIVGGAVGVSLTSAAERVIFKMAMDILAPFRLFVAQVFVLFYTLALSIPLAVRLVRHWDDGTFIVHFPLSRTKTLLLGFLEAVQLLLMVLPAPFVPPPHTILLLQSSLPIGVGISLTTTNMVKSSWHSVGIYLVLLGIALAILPLVFSAEGSRNGSRASVFYSSIMYLSSGVPAALSQAYKERCIIAQDGHICLHSLNFWVSLIQFLFLALLVPLVYMIRYFSPHLNFYPLDGLGDVTAGLLCCLTHHNVKDDDGYPEHDVKCDFALLLEIGYVISALLLGFCLQLIMKTSGKMYHRVPIVVGFCISFTAMVLYAEFLPEMPIRGFNLFIVVGAISIAGGMWLLL